jgi:phage tail-like protein
VRIEGFAAAPDLVGRRARITWEAVFESGETLSDLPHVVLLRKTRDFEFPAGAGGPYVVYDSQAFPGDGTVSELPLEERRVGDTREVVVTESVAVGTEPAETLRRITTTVLGPDDRPQRQRIELIDVGADGQGLAPNVTYDYALLSPLLDTADPRSFRATVWVGEDHRLNRDLYNSLPAILRRHDTTAGPVTPGAENVPEAARRSGQLRRFLDPFGAALDLLRSQAEGIRELHDLDHVDYRYLPHLARWIAWELDLDAVIPLQRHEIRYAAALYRITGTIPGCMVWVRRLSGWNARIHEFHKNVFLTNNLGNPDDLEDQGSRMVDTADSGLMAAMGGFGDEVDYTFDTGEGDDSWYAFNTVGFFIKPPAAESVADVAAKKARLERSCSRFLPANIRGVVIIEAEHRLESQEDRLDLGEGDGGG